MTNSIAIFSFHSHAVRTQIINNEPVFCLTDVTEILGLKNANSSRFNLSSKGVHKMYTPTKGGNQGVTFIDEPNLYRVIFRSNKKEAVEFQNWIFEEVLPAIRKTGSYQVKAKPTTKALPNCLTVEQQKAIQSIVKSRVELLPENKRAKGAITCWSALKSKFGVTYKEIPESEFTEALNVVARIVLDGEVINEKPQCFKPLKWTRIGDQHPNAKHAHTILSEIKRWLYHYDTPVARDLHDALTDVGRVITTATTEMQEAVVNLKIGMHYLNRFRK